MRILSTLAVLLFTASPAWAYTETGSHRAPAGGTFYAYPDSQPLSSWATHRVQLTDADGDGLYEGTLNDTNGGEHGVYSGSSEPASKDANVGTITIAPKVNVTLISSDSTAPDLLEAALEGTGYIYTALPNVWYVDDGGNDSNDGRSWATAKATINATITAASSGDTIKVATGTYADGISVPGGKANLTIEGVSQNGCIVTNGASGPDNVVSIAGRNTTVRRFTINVTNGASLGVGVAANSLQGTLLEDLTISANYDAIQITNCLGPVVRRCSVTSTYDAITCGGSRYVLVEDCRLVTTANWSGPDTDYRAVIGGSGVDDLFTNVVNGTFRRCQVLAKRTTASSQPTGGFLLSGVWTIEDCVVYAEASHASNTGIVYGIQEDLGNRLALTVRGGAIDTTNAGSGSERSIYTSDALSRASMTGVDYDASLAVGNVFNDSPTAAQNNAAIVAGTVGTNSTAILADTNELQTDWANGGRLDLLLDSAVSQATASATSAATAATQATTAATNTAAAAIRSAVGLSSANLATLIDTVDNFVDDLESRITALRASYWDNLNVGGLVASAEDVEDIETGSTLTDVDQEPVPTSRTYTLISTDDEGLVGDKTRSMALSDDPTTFAIDFRNDMAVNDRIATVGTPTLVGSPSTGITFPVRGRDKSQAKVRVAPDVAGTYTIRLTVTYHSGSTATGTFTLVVSE